MQLREKGIALVASLMTLVLVAGLVTLMFARSVNEIKHSSDDSGITESLLLARGGANLASAMLDDTIKSSLSRIVSDRSDPTARWSFGEGNGERPDSSSVVNKLKPVINDLQTSVDGMVCNQSVAPDGSDGTVSMRIYFTGSACGEALPSSVSLPSGRFVEGVARSGNGVGLQTYAIPYVIVVDGVIGDETYKRNVVLQGEYRFVVGRSSFSRYAYFTNSEFAPNGSQLWFTDSTMIDGPAHTNGNFSFAYDPWFGGETTSAGCQTVLLGSSACYGVEINGAFFYGVQSCSSYDWWGRCRSYSYELIRSNKMSPNSSNPSYANSQPSFGDIVDWDAAFVPLPENSSDQEAAAKGTYPAPDTNQNLSTQGLYFNDDLYSLTLYAGDEDGNLPTKNASGEWKPEPKYQFIEACESSYSSSCKLFRTYESKDSYGSTVTAIEEYNNDGWGCLDLDENGKADGNSDNDLACRPFNGVIYSAKDIERFTGPGRTDKNDADTARPALAPFSAITVTAEDDIRITGDLMYADVPCDGTPTRNADRSVTQADCSNTDAKNILGVFSPDGNILVGNNNYDSSQNAPDDVHVHASLMTSEGSITVEDYNLGTPRGAFNLLGGMIQNKRGAFGTFSGQSQKTGFSRVYTYDRRLKMGIAPPYFPTTSSDEVRSISFFSFGQREQIF